MSLSSERPKNVTLSAESPAVEIRVIDAKLNVVARGFGQVAVNLPSGIYDVSYCLGTSVQRDIIAVRPGEAIVRNVRLDFYSAAPLPGSELYDADDATLIKRITQLQPPSYENHGELLICLRALSSEAPPIDAAMTKGIQVFNTLMQPVAKLEEAKNGTPRCQAICLRLPPGSYALRHPAAGAPNANIDQSLHVCAGWRTMVFVPVRRDGPDASLASVHMMEATPWDPEDPNRVRVGIAAEAVLAAYRHGRNALPPELLQLARNNKVDDPMLGLLAAHSLLLAPSPDWDMFDSILSYLRPAIGDHPDFLALEAIGIARRHPANETNPPHITSEFSFPPMLAASYQGLLDIDARWPSLPLITEETAAERVASRLVAHETWCAWEALQGPAERATLAAARATETVKSMFGALGWSAAIISAVLKLVGKSVARRNWTRLQPPSIGSDSNLETLRAYISERVSTTDARTLRSFLDKLTDEHERIRIGLATGLPSRSIEKGLEALRSQAGEVEPES